MLRGVSELLQSALQLRPVLIEQKGQDFHTNNMLLSAQEAVWIYGCVAVVPLILVALILLIHRRLIGQHLGGGIQWSWKQLQPRLSRLDPLSGLRRMFGPIGVGSSCNSAGGEEGVMPTRLLAELVRSAVLHATAVAVLIRVLLSDQIYWLAADFGSVGQLCGVLERELSRFAAWVVAVWVLIGALDLIVEKALHAQRLRMDINELKLELRQTEGSPELKGLRRQLHQAMVMHELVQGVRRAKMLVVNGDVRR